jgi:dipeptidyl aminopeptidase/acylaminoacyl peptidase
MRPDDLLHIRSINDAAISPDGCWVAVVVQRPKNVGEYFQRSNMRGNDRADIWLITSDGSYSVNLTKGESDHAGYWSPVWSPDGRRLAMLSTNGNDNVHLFVWDQMSRQLRRMTERGVDTAAEIVTTGEATGRPLAWLSSGRLLTITLPAGQTPLEFDEDQRTQTIEAVGTDAAMRGTAKTANVVSSDVGAAANAVVPMGIVTAIQVDSGRLDAIASVPITEMRLSSRLLTLSPDRTWATVIAPGWPRRTLPNLPIVVADMYPMRLGVLSLQALGSVHWFEKVTPRITSPSFDQSVVRWAPDGSNFAVLTEGSDEPSRSIGEVTVIDPRTGLTHVVSKAGAPNLRIPALDASDVQWTGEGHLLVKLRAQPTRQDSMISRDPMNANSRVNSDVEEGRADWWLIEGEQVMQNFTDKFSQPVERFLGVLNEKHCLALSGGKLWSVDLNTSESAEISPGSPSIKEIVWPVADVVGGASIDRVIVKVESEEGRFNYGIDLRGSKPAWTRLGDDGDRVVAVGPGGTRIAYVTRDSRLFLTTYGKNAPRKLLTLNKEMGSVANSKTAIFNYKTDDGRPLKGVVLLPYGYEPGKRYPLVSVVYAGTVDSSRAFDRSLPYSEASSNPLLLAALGYAVLAPSMPLEPMGAASDPLLDLDKGVAPAIQAVIDMGIADPNRLAVWGWSYGGYSVYGLVIQTQRFRAAIAGAGVTDLISLYGTFDHRYRYSPYGGGSWLGPYILESQQFRMGVPPWTDGSRYLRNSPVAHADQVQTPLLMIQGTNDVFGAGQTEEFFAALNRLGKPVELVRYVGESHSIESPPNILDFWYRTYAWLDRFLDISRDSKGNLEWEGDKVKSRAGAAPLTPDDFARFR